MATTGRGACQIDAVAFLPYKTGVSLVCVLENVVMTAAPHPLMPKATAAWLLEHTTLTFQQISDFCGLHELEVQALADAEGDAIVRPLDPVAMRQLTLEEIRRCEKDEKARLQLAHSNLPKPKPRTKGPRYTPLTKRGDKPNAIAWLVKHHPELSDAQISKLIGTTKGTISKIRDKSHWNMLNIKPSHPVELGLCTLPELEQAVSRTGKPRPVVLSDTETELAENY
jgi:uncharacterized protein